VPDRIANKIILAEDPEQQNLVRRYLERCGHQAPFRLVALPAKASGGSGEKYVRDQYPAQVRACRSSLGRKAGALLVVIVDADTETTAHRATQLEVALRNTGEERRTDSEPIVVLIPKRHVETWIRALLGDPVNETTDYKNPKPTSQEIRQAAEALYPWTRPGADLRPNFPPSLNDSRPEWRKIPS
jgi:hypothetical protein